MDQFRIAITWGLKEPSYSSSPFLPDWEEQSLGSWESLALLVSDCHALHGSEISFYWCFPFWVLAAHLQPRGIAVAGLAEFARVGLQPDLIFLVDLPVRRSDLNEMASRFPGVPVVLMVAETPLERQAQHQRVNVEGFAALMSYNSSLMKKCPQGIVSNLPFRFYHPTGLEKRRPPIF